MADFITSRNALLKSRKNYSDTKQALAVSNDRLRRYNTELDGLLRQRSDNDPEFIKKRRAIEEKIAAEKQSNTRLRTDLAAGADSLGINENNFSVFIDPRRELASHFANDTPFLLFPLRIETRFKTVDNKRQLWIRVYPDDCLVDSFEALLSRKEVNNGARFWAEYYGAGQPSDPANPDPATLELQKSAWRLLVSAHGDGRSACIVKQLIPDAASIFPKRGNKTVILAILTTSWNPANQATITGLFSKLWFANKNQALITQIKSDFDGANPGMTADDIIASYRPVNFDDKLPEGLKREDVDLQFAIVIFKDLDKIIGKEHSWSQPSTVNLMPERLALILYKNGVAKDPIFGNAIPYPLHTSPDPSADPADQFKQTPDHDLEFGDDIRWLADFDRAVNIGMGFRVDLEPDEVRGFSSLLILGVRLSSDKHDGKLQLQNLFDHHFYSRKGFALVPQGTPTNNTEGADSGYGSMDMPDKTFDLYLKNKAAYIATDDLSIRQDGQWFANWLGLDYDFTKKILYADGFDQADARNMNTALWPGTLGYVMSSLMKGGFSDEVIDSTRDFFNEFVSGRGPVPAIRIGNQPYGILPTSAFNRLRWMNSDRFIFRNNQMRFVNGLYALLVRLENFWNANFLNKAAHISEQSGTPYQTLLDVIKLHPNSVEFYRRYMETLIEMSNAMSLMTTNVKQNPQVVENTRLFLKNTLGYPTDILPQLAALLGLPWQVLINILIDDSPISESKVVRDYTADKRNYIAALVDQARESENALRTGTGFTERPAAELYRLLKYALEQEYHNSGIKAADSVAAFPAAQLAAMQEEKPFTHQLWKGEVTESRYSLLYETVPKISPTMTVADFVRESLVSAVTPPFSKYLSTQINAIDKLKGASTARLERALVEHIDTLSYRLDAWKTAIVTYGLSLMRAATPADGNNEQQQPGIFLGTYGWLLNVVPETRKMLTQKEIPDDLVTDFNPDGKRVYVTDPTNEGYIHAPSLNQAVTAAVLRNGYVSHGKPDGNNVLAVNLSSDRIRVALSVIEGIQGGQSLAALLGYHLERELHDRSDLTAKKIDSYIYQLRKFFPLNSDQLKDTKVENTSDSSVDPQTVPITAIEARNVVHGVNLSNHVKNQKTDALKTYPFGLDMTNDDPLIAAAITEAVVHIIDIADAIGDLGMAESVHQVVMGNYDRAAGVMETYSKGNYPQEPDVIRTPRSGATLTHRVGIPMDYINLSPGTGPRPQTEPSMNAWLSTVMPAPGDVVCCCSYISRADKKLKPIEISLADIGLKPIDILYVLNVLDTHASNELDDRFIRFIQELKDPLLDGNILINYTEESSDANKLSVFQLMPLVKSLRAILLQSTTLTPGDIALPNEANKKDIPSPELPAKRANDLIKILQDLLAAARMPAAILDYLKNLPTLDTATDGDKENMLLKFDDTISRFSAFLNELSLFGLPQTSTGQLYSTRQQLFISLKNKVQEVIKRWQQKSDDYAALASSPITPETLAAMEKLVSTSSTPLASITLAIVNGKKLAFDNAFLQLKNIHDDTQPTIIKLVQDIRGFNLNPFDLLSLDISAELNQMVVFIIDQQIRAKSLTDDIEGKRIPSASAILTNIETLAPDDQVKQINAAVKFILGDDFKMIPRYKLPSAQSAEFSNAWNAKDSLLDHLINTEKRFNPTEDWLHGIARVHNKMKHAENCLMLRQAYGMPEDDFTLHPLQLPYKTDKYHWLALPFPKDDIDLEATNILLFTALVKSVAPVPTEVCGLLIDEWTELIPATEETTGISFHYDRPNCEAAQSLLLVTPTTFEGNWQWNDLVDALVYTLNAARSRAVDPMAIEGTPLTALLPAVLSAESLYPYTIVLDNKAHYMDIADIKKLD